jgi:D-aminopeptidase
VNAMRVLVSIDMEGIAGVVIQLITMLGSI